MSMCNLCLETVMYENYTELAMNREQLSPVIEISNVGQCHLIHVSLYLRLSECAGGGCLSENKTILFLFRSVSISQPAEWNSN